MASPTGPVSKHSDDDKKATGKRKRANAFPFLYNYNETKRENSSPFPISHFLACQSLMTPGHSWPPFPTFLTFSDDNLCPL